MRQETDRLREPAAWALVGFVALQLAVDALRVLFGVGSGVHGFRARAYGGQSALLDVLTPVLLAGAVLLATHAGRPTPRARVITRAALGVLALQGAVGLTAALGGLAYDGGGFADIPAGARVEQSAINVGVLVMFALCAWFLLVVLGAPATPTVTRGKSLPHQEWLSHGRDATGAGQPVGTSGQYPAYSGSGARYAGATGEHHTPTDADRPRVSGPEPSAEPASTPPRGAATGSRTAVSETGPQPVVSASTPGTGTPAVPPRPGTPPAPPAHGGTRP
ncbi:hypothetical protein [Embleya sp. NPDC001921]